VKSDRASCATTLNLSIQIVRSLSILFAPVVPFSSDRIWKMLNLQGTLSGVRWNEAAELAMPEGHVLGKPEIIFRKIEDMEIEKELEKLGPPAGPAEPAVVPPAFAPLKPLVTFDDFQKLDLRVARIVGCEPVPKSKKLLRMQIEFGTEKRQIVAGIAQQRTPEQLIGKLVIVVANLAPATLMGVESQGMLLATSGDGEAFALLTVTNDVPTGSWIK
jgi:methionyl-tRNA synthetase